MGAAPDAERGIVCQRKPLRQVQGTRQDSIGPIIRGHRPDPFGQVKMKVAFRIAGGGCRIGSAVDIRSGSKFEKGEWIAVHTMDCSRKARSGRTPDKSHVCCIEAVCNIDLGNGKHVSRRRRCGNSPEATVGGNLKCPGDVCECSAMVETNPKIRIDWIKWESKAVLLK